MENKSTIFGEEHFIDINMIHFEYNKAFDSFVFDEMTKTANMIFPRVKIDKEKLQKWIQLCMKLENIEQSELVDMATKKRITDLEAKLYEKDTELQYCNNARVDWKMRAESYSDLIIDLNNVLPNKQQQEINFAKVIEDIKKLIADKDTALKRIREINLYNKDLADTTLKQLAEREKENRDLHTIINMDITNQIAMKDEIERLHTCRDKRISELLDELALTDKALELACETYWNDCGMEDCPADMPDEFSDTYKKCASCFNGGDRVINDKGCCYVDYFKAKAKEMMKSE